MIYLSKLNNCANLLIGEPAEWQNVTLGNSDGISGGKFDNRFVSVLVDHF
jgi:hypothetical protein